MPSLYGFIKNAGILLKILAAAKPCGVDEIKFKGSVTVS